MTQQEINELEAQLLQGNDFEDMPGNPLEAEKIKGKSPHKLIAIPRSLLASKKWQDLPCTAKTLYLYLLSHSDTRTFKDSWPGTERIEEELGITKKRRIIHENKLAKAKLLKVHQPGRTVKDSDGKYFTLKGKSYEFTIIEYINADYIAYNKASGAIKYRPVVDRIAVEKQVRRIEQKSGQKLMSVLTTKQGETLVFDMFSKRLKIDSADDLGRVHVILYSSVFQTDLVKGQLPDCVILKQETKNKDLVIDPKMTWQKFCALIEKEKAYAEHRRKMSKLINLVDAVDSIEKSNVN